MSSFSQVGAVTKINLLSIRERLPAVLVIVSGIAGAVGVLVSVLSLSTGLQRTLNNAGRADRIVAHSARGGLSRGSIATIMNAPGIRHGSDGRPVASTELFAYAFATKATSDQEYRVTVRGVSPGTVELRPELKITEGRMFRPALRELIVGEAAHSRFRGLNVGSHVQLPDGDWVIVGRFNTGGGGLESELLGDVSTLMSVSHSEEYDHVLATLTSQQSLDELKAALIGDSKLDIEVERESDYYFERASGFYGMLKAVAYAVGAIMTIGALLGALNTIYSIVSARAREIATLRAIGFGAVAVVVSILVEALLLGFGGAILGAGAAWLLFDGNSTSLLAGFNNAQIVFSLAVTGELLRLGILWGCLTGIAGGLLPAISAARLSVAAALRAI
jgi:putative ABC transport system permease protein